MASLIHQTESWESRPRAMDAKGTLVVGADPSRESELVEESGEDSLGIDEGGTAEPLAAEQVPAEAVLDGERVAVDPVAGLELALEASGSPPSVLRGVHSRV